MYVFWLYDSSRLINLLGISIASVIILIWSIPVTMVTTVSDGIMNALNQPIMIKIAAGLSNIFGFIISYLFAEGDLFYPIYLVIRNLGLFICATYLLCRKIQILSHIQLSILTEISDLLIIVKKLFISRLTTNTFTSTEPLIISLITTPEFLVAYNTTRKAGDFLRTLLDRISGILLTPFSELLLSAENEVFRYYLKASYILALIISILSFLTYFHFNELFVNMWVGETLYAGDNLTALFTLVLIFAVNNNALAFMLTSVEEYLMGARIVFWENFTKIIMLVIGYWFASVNLVLWGLVCSSVVFAIILLVVWINWFKGQRNAASS
jgi:O-antigen/teichoic acid export membrane protein